MDPVVESINRTSAGGPLTNASSVEFTVRFSEAVTGVAPFDFRPVLSGSVDATVTRVAPVTGSVYTVSVTGITGNGTLGLNVVSSGSIDDLAGTLCKVHNPFQGPQTYATARGPGAVAFGDLNDGDGIPDIAIADSGSKTVSVLLGNGNGTYESQQTFATGDYVNSVAIGDVNGDEKTTKPTSFGRRFRQVSGSRGFERGR